MSFVKTLKAAACGHLPGRPSLVALACSGGDAGLIADYAERNGLGLPSFDAGQRDELAGVLPDYANIANPLDFTTAIWGDAAALEEMLDSALRSPADAALLVLDYPGEETGERPQCDLLLQRYCAALKRHGKSASSPRRSRNCCRRARELLHGEGVAALQGVEDGLAAWGRIARYRQRRAAAGRGEAALVPICPGPLAGDGYLLDGGNQAGAEILRPATAPGVLSTPGEPASGPRPRLPAGAQGGQRRAAAQDRGPAAWPAQRGGAGGGIVRHARKPGPARAATGLRACVAGAHGRRAAGRELIVGVKREEGFGLALVIGAGGILVELLRDSRSLLLPTTDAAIRDALLSLRSAVAQRLPRSPGGIHGGPGGGDPRGRQIRLRTCRALAGLDVNPLLADAEGRWRWMR